MATKKAKTTTKMTPREDYAKRVQSTVDAEQKLLGKYELGRMLFIAFPKRKKMPFLSKVAIKIIAWQGGEQAVRYIDLKKHK